MKIHWSKSLPSRVSNSLRRHLVSSCGSPPTALSVHTEAIKCYFVIRFLYTSVKECATHTFPPWRIYSQMNSNQRCLHGCLRMAPDARMHLSVPFSRHGGCSDLLLLQSALVSNLVHSNRSFSPLWAESGTQIPRSKCWAKGYTYLEFWLCFRGSKSITPSHSPTLLQQDVY